MTTIILASHRPSHRPSHRLLLASSRLTWVIRAWWGRTLPLLLASAGLFLGLSSGQASHGEEAAATAVRQGQPIASTTNIVAQHVVAQLPFAGFNGERSYGYLKALCNLGNRRSGSLGMKKQQALLEKHFTELGAKVTYQRLKVMHPFNRKYVLMANMIIEWHPEAKRRILLCAHYDTRPKPDNEVDPRVRSKGLFVGANDGASGVALLMELGHHLGQLPLNYGLDFVLFDGEELIYSDGRQEYGDYFHGSTWFAQQYVKNPPVHKYTAGVLFDMVADANLTIYQEHFSVTWSQTRPLVKEIWGTAQRLGVREFIPRKKYEVRDDHLPLNQIAKIPVCDVIDFEYPDSRRRYWHTTADSPENCSADSLAKVGWVTLEWLKYKH